jgi:ATP-dependent helicase/nuclease subunit A
MYREDNGTLVIVDFKTDIHVPQERLGSYWRQLSTYARMVERITGQTVSELVLIFCRAGEAGVMRQSRQSRADDDL